MLYRQQVKNAKTTREENVEWLDNTDNYKQPKKTTLLQLVYWYYTMYVLLVKIKAFVWSAHVAVT